MSNTVTLGGKPITVSGKLPAKGEQAPAFSLVGKDLADVTLASLGGKRKILNIFPSIDTGVCQASVRKFNELAASLDNTTVVNVSKDLPFAQARFCGAEGIENVVSLSMMRSRHFAKDYGVLIEDGPLAGITARAVVVLDADNRVVYTQLVPEITEEPDYEAALAAL